MYEYTHLTPEHRAEMLSNLITRRESEHYSHSLNIIALESLPDDDPGKAAALQVQRTAMDAIEAALTDLRAEGAGPA